MILVLYFFFSSRRRHTRLQGDWSSDVCSSDLGPQNVVHGRGRWDGADWIPGRASRIVVADTFLARVVPLKDTILSYTLEVVNYYGGAPTTPTTASGTFAVEIGRASCRERV